VAHVADAIGWFAAHLAVPSSTQLRFDFRVHDNASNDQLLDVVSAAAATLASVAVASPPDARGFHPFGMADVSGFVALAANEILVHGWDVQQGFEHEFEPPAEDAERVVRRLFPWSPTDTPPWPTLLWANGRRDLPGRPRATPNWMSHCAPLDEWDGTVPTRDG